MREIKLIRISLELAQEFNLISKVYYRSHPSYDYATHTVVVDADELNKRASEYADKAIEKSRRPPRPLGKIIEELAETWARAVVRVSDYY